MLLWSKLKDMFKQGGFKVRKEKLVGRLRILCSRLKYINMLNNEQKNVIGVA